MEGEREGERETERKGEVYAITFSTHFFISANGVE